MKAAIHGSSKERALSPKSREDFKGKLIILKEGSQGSAPECLQKRLEPVSIITITTPISLQKKCAKFSSFSLVTYLFFLWQILMSLHLPFQNATTCFLSNLKSTFLIFVLLS